MRHLALALLMATTAAVPAFAGCIDEIRAVYTDPFKRPPYRAIKSVQGGGKELRQFHDTVETPLRTISAVNGKEATLVIDRDYWTGPSPTGPWTKGAQQMPEGRKETVKRQYREEVKNMKNPECLGPVEIDGRKLIHYRFVTQTDPDPARGGMFFGAKSDLYVDPSTKLIICWDQSEMISSFAPGVSKEVHISRIEYDQTIKVTAPQ